MINIDFFAEAQEYISNKGNNIQQGETNNPVVSKPVELTPKPNEENPLDLFPEIQGFTVSEDCKTLTFKGITYTIPDFYNKDMIAIRDKKTLDMVFISLGIDF